MKVTKDGKSGGRQHTLIRRFASASGCNDVVVGSQVHGVIRVKLPPHLLKVYRYTPSEAVSTSGSNADTGNTAPRRCNFNDRPLRREYRESLPTHEAIAHLLV